MPPSSKRSRRPSSQPHAPPVQHGVGIELDDDELFSHLPIRASSRRASNTTRASPPKRPRFQAPVHETPSHSIKPKLPHQSPQTDPPNPQSLPKTDVKIPPAIPQWKLVRDGLKPSPASLDEMIAENTLPEGDCSKRLQGVPRLSSIALSAARTSVSSNRLTDLSRLPDYYAFAILSTSRINASKLEKLESANPSRIPLMEALWAVLIHRMHSVKDRPPEFGFWRAYFHSLNCSHEERVERARERVRSVNAAAHNGRGGGQQRLPTVSVGFSSRQGVRRGGQPLSRLERLRQEFRRERRRGCR